MTGIGTGSVQANGITFHYLEMGQGPLVLCLHGFPDHAYTYEALLPRLAEAGFRGVAPFMRGYAPTSAAADDRYQSVLLSQDALALLDAFDAEPGLLVGHDWGAQCAPAPAPPLRRRPGRPSHAPLPTLARRQTHPAKPAHPATRVLIDSGHRRRRRLAHTLA